MLVEQGLSWYACQALQTVMDGDPGTRLLSSMSVHTLLCTSLHCRSLRSSAEECGEHEVPSFPPPHNVSMWTPGCSSEMGARQVASAVIPTLPARTCRNPGLVALLLQTVSCVMSCRRCRLCWRQTGEHEARELPQ